MLLLEEQGLMHVPVEGDLTDPSPELFPKWEPASISAPGNLSEGARRGGKPWAPICFPLPSPRASPNCGNE